MLPIVPILVFLAFFYVFPLLSVLKLSVTEPAIGLDHYERLATTPIYLKVLSNTFQIAFIVAVLAVVLGYFIAYLIANIGQRWSTLLLICVLVPFFTGVIVRNYAWIFMLGSNGVVNGTLRWLGITSEPIQLIFNRLGVIVAMVHVLLPYTVLVLLSVMRGIDKRLLTAAASLSAGPFTAFRRVFLPLTSAGAGGAFVLVFVLALAFFVTPAMVGGPAETMLANLIAQQTGLLNWGFAAALSTCLLVASLLLIWLMQRLFGGLGLVDRSFSAAAPARKRVREGAIMRRIDRILDPVWPALPHAIGGLGLIYLALPILITLPLSVNDAPYLSFPPQGFTWRWYDKFFSDPDWIEATVNSLKVAALATAITMALAVPASIAIARSSSSFVARFAYALILSPLILPGIIIAIAVFALLTTLGLTGTITGVALGHVIGCLPLATVVLVAALRSFDRNLERASLSLGAGPVRTVRLVVLPVVGTAAFSATFFAFLHSFDELLVSLFVSGVYARTLPKKMWESLEEIDPIIAAVSTLLILVSVAAVLIYGFLGQRKPRRAGAAR
ncbi:ABC transporter permease subunit [Bosea sp. (in: a-proteobacteria)]|uniref:ABC transporter permease subunit n=1 Tax=Bosea sp. (in: a-proteobacteria) TaxID=1871050 RepID=UPI0026302BDD|nr:ABC transporter permease subunit [Bosea sp. (in: a-proteobacteria)]MCO5089779.1 ABC transporter permease subunit [Bosea sp. (in: a-proteobacteria)]